MELFKVSVRYRMTIRSDLPETGWFPFLVLVSLLIAHYITLQSVWVYMIDCMLALLGHAVLICTCSVLLIPTQTFWNMGTYKIADFASSFDFTTWLVHIVPVSQRDLSITGLKGSCFFFFKVILQKLIIEVFNIALMCAIVCFSCPNKHILLEPFRMCY